MQYNSPLGIYSDKSAAEQYVQQTQGLGDNSGWVFFTWLNFWKSTYSSIWPENIV